MPSTVPCFHRKLSESPSISVSGLTLLDPSAWLSLPTVILMVYVPPPEAVCACPPLHLPVAHAFGWNKDT